MYNLNGYAQNNFGKIAITKFEMNQENKFDLNKLIFKDSNSSGITFREVKRISDKKNNIHITFQQYYNGIEILGGIVKVHYQNNIPFSYNGYAFSTKNINVNQSISDSQALSAAKKFVGGTNHYYLKNDSEFTNVPPTNFSKIYVPNLSNKSITLAKAITIGTTMPESKWGIVYIEASSGKVLKYKNLLFTCFKTENHSHDEPVIHFSPKNKINNAIVSGSAQTAYTGTRTFETTLSGSNYILYDQTRANTSFSHNTGSTTGTKNGIATVNLNHQEYTSYASATNAEFTDNNNSWTTAEMSANEDQYALDAHWNAQVLYDYWNTNYSWKSYDNTNSALVSYVHWSNNMFNAAFLTFTNGRGFMVYGDGNSSSNPLTAFDVSAHEIAHGMTSNSSDLEYNGESGALNEGMSDIWAVLAENYLNTTFGTSKNLEQLGSEFYTSSNYLRSMSNPNARNQPDTYGGTYWVTPSCGTPDSNNDYCGVHTNSGVFNYWFWLAANGGSGTNDIGNSFNVSGIGYTKMGQIIFRMQTVYLTANSDFTDARDAAITSASDLYGACSSEVQTITKAWYAVGVGANYTTPSNPVVTTQPTAVSGCLSSTVAMSVVANNASTYQWQANYSGSTWTNLTDNSNYSGTTTSQLSITINATTTPYNYRCVVKNACGTLVNSSQAATSFSQTVIISSQTATAKSCTNESVSINVVSPNATTYQWQGNFSGSTWTNISDNANYLGATTNQLSILISAATAPYNYRCIVSDNCGSANTANIAVSISTFPVVTVSKTDYICSSDKGSFTFAFPDNANQTQIELSINNGSSYIQVADNSGSYTFTNVDSGNYTLWSRWGDDSCAINLGDFIIDIGVDNEQPVVSCKNYTLTLDALGQGTLSQNNVVNTKSDNCGISSVVLSKINFTCADIGTNVVAVTVYDAAGNSATCNATVTVQDTITITNNIFDQAICENSDVSIFAEATGAISYQWEVQINGTGNFSALADNVNYSGTTTNTLNILNIPFSFNNNNYRCVFTNTCGSIAISNVSNITIIETPSLTITPVDVTCGSTTGSITIAFADHPSFSSVQLSIDNGANYISVLDNTVSYTYNNLTPGTYQIWAYYYASCKRYIGEYTIQSYGDTENPIITCKDYSVTLDAMGNASITSNNVINSATDNCGIDSITLSKTNFTCADAGVNMVVVTVTDLSGNTAQCNAQVTILDTVAPVISVGSTIPELEIDASGVAICTENNVLVNSTVTDACGTIASYSFSPASFGCNQINSGILDVIVTVTDVSGNQATATVQVDVVDHLVPILQTQDLTITLDENNEASISYNDVLVSYISNCGGYSGGLSKSVFGCEDVGVNTITVTMNDNHGNIGYATAQITVLDQQAPIFVAGNDSFVPSLKALNNVAEASDYLVAYEYNIKTGGSIGTSIPYTRDNSSLLPTNYNRVAYFLQLDNNWIWISMDDFTSGNITQLGIPHLTLNDVTWETSVTNMNVASNVAGIVTGNSITTGNIEIWKGDQNPTSNDYNVTGFAGNIRHDFDDQPKINNANSYGIFQVHNYGAQQTLFAFNRFYNSSNHDLGIGNDSNSTITTWDYYGKGGIANYNTAKLYMLIENPIDLEYTVTIDETGSVTVTPQEILGSYYFHDCSPLTYTLTQDTFTCLDVGNTIPVTITATDSNGLQANITYMITVEKGNLACIDESEYFITTWETTIDGESITIPTTGTGYNYLVDWGDGTTTTHSDADATTDATHSYTTAGLYTVKIAGDFPRIYFNNNAESDKVLQINQWGTIQWTNMANAFNDCQSLTILALDAPDLSNVTSLRYMFRACYNLIDSDFSNWDTSTITDMVGVFYADVNFNGNITNWNVGKVTSFNGMFYLATAMNQDISAWNIGEFVAGNVSMQSMFEQDYSFNIDISSWDVSKVNNFSKMFKNATAFDKNLGDWDISSAINMTSMFTNVTLSIENYDSTLIGWSEDSSGLTGDGIDEIPLSIIFDGGNSKYCIGEVTRNSLINVNGWTIIDAGLECSDVFITTWGTTSNNETINIPTTGSGYNYFVSWGDGTISNHTGSSSHSFVNPGVYTVKIMGDFPRIYFNGTGDKSKIKAVNQWGTGEWSSMENAFMGCTNLDFLASDIPALSNVTDFGRILNDTGTITTNLNDWDTSTINDLAFAFAGSHFNGQIDQWNTSAVQSFLFAFSFNSNFNQNIGNWNTSNANNFNSMFRYATNFNQNLGNWDLTNATNMQDMFLGAVLSTTNYDATLIGWAEDSSGIAGDGIDDIPMNITFNGGNSKYCASEMERDLLINTYGWTINDGGKECLTVVVSPKVFLQGAFTNPTTTGLMNDNLRSGGMLPTISPYSDAVNLDMSVLNTGGISGIGSSDDDVVDWIWLELRDSLDYNILVSSTSALIQRDGDIVNYNDGISPVVFDTTPDSYYLVINHRNHLPIMSANPIILSSTSTNVDFTNDLNMIYGGSNAMNSSGGGVYSIFSGDYDNNGQVQNSDLNEIAALLGLASYSEADLDMNGQVQNTDINLILEPNKGKGKQF